jgi:hypothetical protein
MSDQEDSGNSPDTLAAERSGIECEGSFCSGALRFAINWENDEWQERTMAVGILADEC